jgi:hypothetical protein
MRRTAMLLGVVFVLVCTVLTCSASAQENAADTLLLASASTGGAANSPAGGGIMPTTLAIASASGTAASVSSMPSEPAALPQGVYGVFQNFNWQAYMGYTFVRFTELPGAALNENGFNYSIVYYFKNWVGADGEFVATFGSQSGSASRFLVGAGGPRFRLSSSRGVEFWAHALVGASHFTPQTAYGKETALGYEVGGGIDISAHHRRWAYRVEADAVGTQFFSTYQISPKLSAGVVFKF